MWLLENFKLHLEPTLYFYWEVLVLDHLEVSTFYYLQTKKYPKRYKYNHSNFTAGKIEMKNVNDLLMIIPVWQLLEITAKHPDQCLLGTSKNLGTPFTS